MAYAGNYRNKFAMSDIADEHREKQEARRHADASASRYKAALHRAISRTMQAPALPTPRRLSSTIGFHKRMTAGSRVARHSHSSEIDRNLSYSGSEPISSVDASTETLLRRLLKDTDTRSRATKKTTGIIFHNDFQQILYAYVESKSLSAFMLFTVLLHTLVISAATFYVVDARAGWYISIFEFTVLGMYNTEAIIKIYAYRAAYFRAGWNIVEGSLVIMNMIYFLLPLIGQSISGVDGNTIFRIHNIFFGISAVKALNVIRIVRFLSNLQVVLATILQSLKSIGYIAFLIWLVMYMFAVIGRGLYGTADRVNFGGMIVCHFTLFRLLTLDDWFDIYREMLKKDPTKEHVIIYLMLYIVVEYFVFLNLFVAVLVDNFQLAIQQRTRDKESQRLMKKESLHTVASDYEEMYSAHQKEAKDTAVKQATYEPIIHYYPGLSRRALIDLRRYFLLLASIEYNVFQLHNEHRVLEMMVNTTTESEDAF